MVDKQINTKNSLSLLQPQRKLDYLDYVVDHCIGICPSARTIYLFTLYRRVELVIGELESHAGQPPIYGVGKVTVSGCHDVTRRLAASHCARRGLVTVSNHNTDS